MERLRLLGASLRSIFCSRRFRLRGEPGRLRGSLRVGARLQDGLADGRDRAARIAPMMPASMVPQGMQDRQPVDGEDFAHEDRGRRMWCGLGHQQR